MSTEINSSFDLDNCEDFRDFIFTLDNFLDDLGTANACLRKVGHLAMARLIQQSAPSTFRSIKKLETQLDENGFVVIKNTLVNEQSEDLAQLTSIAIASIFGKPTKTDQRNEQIAWPIKYDPTTTLDRTFSQSQGEAAFHTDTQYYMNPEKYFGLFCVFSDVAGKGTNRLQNGLVLLEQFESEFGKHSLKQLRKPFPFRVPSVFTKEASNDSIEIVCAPIHDVTKNTIRYRKDTIDKALETGSIEITSDQQHAIDNFNTMLNELPSITYHLKQGEAMIVDNHTMLHARTKFDNPNRLLYRVRMASEDSL